MFGATALMTQTFCLSLTAPAVLKLAVGAVAVLSAFRPDVGLLVIAGFVPFGRILGTEVFNAYPAHLTEALVLAFLSGWLASRFREESRRLPDSSTSLLAILLAATVVASVLVEVVVLRHWKDYWWPFSIQLFRFLFLDFLRTSVGPWPTPLGMDGGAWLNSAALLLEGVALAFAVRHVIARDRSVLPALLRVMVVAAVGTAILSLSAAAGQATIDAARAGRDELRIFNGPRLSVHTPKTNTAASSFVLFLPIALGLGLDKFRTRRTLNTSVADTARGLVAPVLGATGLFAALWITGSRSGLVAVLVVAVVAAGTWIAGSLRGRARLLQLAAQITVLAVTATVVGFGVYQKAWSIPKQASLTVAAVRVRQLGLLTSVRMLRESPWFGVGIGRYYVESRRVTPEAIEYRMERPFNAHNQFLQVAAELGVVGFVLFTGFIGVVCYRAWIAFRRSRDHLLGAVLAGLGAFLITSLVGQPLLVEVVAYPFWLVLGVALAYGDDVAPSVAGGQGRGRARTLISIGFLLVLAVSVPIRASKALDRVDLSAVAYGFSAPGTGADGVASRMVRGQGTFFLKADVRRLDLPLMRHQPGSDPLTVELFLDGKRASWVSLSSDRWETMTVFILPKDEIRYRRIDLKIAAPSGADPVARVGTPGTSQTRW